MGDKFGVNPCYWVALGHRVVDQTEFLSSDKETEIKIGNN